jgi:hypothetical protein
VRTSTLRLIVTWIVGVIAMFAGASLAPLLYAWIRLLLDHVFALGITGVMLIGWVVAVFAWWGRQWNGWYSR